MATKTAYRQAAARLIGPFRAGTASGGSSVGQLEDATWPVKTSRQVDDLYTDQFLYVPTMASAADYVRVVDSYTPNTGLLMPDLPWSESPAGQAYEIHGIVEPHAEMTQLLDDVLRILVFVNDEVSFTPAADVRRHALSAACPWLADRTWVRQGGWLAPTDVRDQVDPYDVRPVRGEVEEDGGAYYLKTYATFDGTETIYLRVLKPAYYHCRPAAGVFGAQAGLVLESDECSVDENWVAAGARVMVWDRLGTMLSAGNADLAKKERAEAAQAFAFWTKRLFKPYEMTLQPLEAWGPGQAGVPN